jgi:enoyl-[acyl-carrier-protein] reductase (NADH)
MGFLTGKRALVVGLATERSIAHGIAQAMHREGAELAFTFQNDRLKERVVDMARGFGSELTMPLDVASDAEIDATFGTLREAWGSLDVIVHSVAFAPREQLAGGFLDSITRDGFRVAHDISSYSLAALAKAGRPLMKGRAGAMLTLTYLGAVRSIPSYNVMGLAKASLEANVRFLAADLDPWAFVSTESPRARSRRWLRPESAGFAGCSRTSRPRRRCGVTLRSMRSATPRHSCARTSRPASPAKCCTWTPAIATWECRSPTTASPTDQRVTRTPCRCV